MAPRVTEPNCCGDYVRSALALGIQPRTFPTGMEEAFAAEWYDIDRVYVSLSDSADPNDRSLRVFNRPGHYLYEVEPEDLGIDRDIAAAGNGWASCA